VCKKSKSIEHSGQRRRCREGKERKGREGERRRRKRRR
jgi:hypothetical protein